MQTFTIGWPCRWPFHGLGRNELLRLSDRIESIAVVICGILAVIAVPLVASIGTSVHDHVAAERAQHAASVQQAMATVVGEPEASAAYPLHRPWSVPVSWYVAGSAHRGTVTSDVKSKVGEQLSIWVDREGTLTTPPAPLGSATANAVGVAVALWLALIGACAGVLQLVRWRLDAGRFARWDRELESLADDGGGRTRR